MKAIQENTIGKLLFKVRTSKTPQEVKQAMFDLSFYLVKTEATAIVNFKQEDWGNTAFYLMNQGYLPQDFAPIFCQPNW